MQSESKMYEIAYVLRAESEENATSILDNAKKFIENKGGINLEESRPMKRRLAYPFKKEREAFFGNIKFFLKPENVKELDDTLRKDSSFLRHMLAMSAKFSEKRSGIKKARKVTEQDANDIKEIDKKLEEILGQ